MDYSLLKKLDELLQEALEELFSPKEITTAKSLLETVRA